MIKARPAIAFTPLASLALAGCITIDNRASPSTATCREGPGQAFIGQKATPVVGTAILRATGAKTLRWGAPGAVFTMDLRPDRVNVRYEEHQVITTVKCG